MNMTQRFTLLMKGSITSLFDAIEDPERSLNQLVIDMDEQLDRAKRATAQAMANEQRLEAQVRLQEKEASDWQQHARRALEKGREEDAREALLHVERAERHGDKLRQQLAEQRNDTEQIRESVTRLHDQMRCARQRLHVLHARMRQSEARRAMGKVIQSVDSANLYGEFDRLGERVELRAAEEAAYLNLGSELSGDDVKRRFEADAVAGAVDDRLVRLRASLHSGDGDTASGDAASGDTASGKASEEAA